MRPNISILRAGLIMAVLLAWATVSEAHILIFKDGFTLHGRIREPGEYITDDPTGQPFFITKGVFLLDSDARMVGFSHHQVPPEGVIEKDVVSETDSVKLEQKSLRTGRPMYPILRVGEATEWTADWNRTVRMRVNAGTQITNLDVEQRLAVLTPQYLRVDGKKYNWTSFYRLAEFDPVTIRNLLFNFPEMKGKDTKDDPAWRQRVYQFFVQAGWYDLAEAELAGIEKDLPDQKDTVEQAKQSLMKLKAIYVFDEIEKAQQAGRHEWAQEYLAKIPLAAMDDKLRASVRESRTKYEALNEKLSQARRLLKELPPKLTTERRQLFDKAVTAILEELDHDNVVRLDTFLVQAQQAKPPDAAELLALAVSGWLLGKDAADGKVEVADRLWKARQFALDYQATDDATERGRKLKEYQSTPTDALAADEMTQIIHHLPPPKADKELGTAPLRRKTERLGSNKGAEYVVQLPPEYRHSRPYPVVVVLHAGGGDTAADMVKRVAGLAARHGYVVVAPNWEVWGNTYEHSTEENERVTDVIFDLRRRFQIDSDRVFLLGAGEGGQVAFDVGLSHPDLFAGVMPMSAAPLKHAGRYWANAQYLPFYVVDGTFSGDTAKSNQELFKKWVPLGFPGIYVQYKGRGAEWFAGELPTMFDWMDRKKDQFKRATAVPELGRQGGSLPCEFLSLRNSDTRFYWLSTDGLLPNQAVDGRAWKNNTLGGNLYGRIHEGTIHVNSRNHKRLTVWLTRDMIDFTKPVSVRINREPRMNNQRIQPSLKVLLDDLYERGDRQRLYWAKLEFDR